MPDPSPQIMQRIISSPGKLRILRALLAAPETPGALAAALDVSPGTASNHLAALHGFGLVRSIASGRERIYSIQPQFDTRELLDALKDNGTCTHSCCNKESAKRLSAG